MLKKIILFSVFLLSILKIYSQEENFEAFSVLKLKFSSHLAALQMDYLPYQINDISSAINNPSSLSEKTNNQIGLSYTDLFANIWQGSIYYGRSFEKLGHFAFGLNYIGYGTFDRTEANGDVVGRFSANDYLFTIGWGRKLDTNLYIGASIKPIFSQYDTYLSIALAFDLSLTYIWEEKGFGAAVLLRNFGTQLKVYNEIEEKLPFDLSLTITKKLKHAPFQLFVSANNLQKWNLREDDPLNPRDEVDPFTGEIKKENAFLGTLDNIFRHLNFGINFSPSKHFYLALGYSWKQSREMYLSDAFSLAGFSYGFGIMVKRFQISYSRAEYHKFGSPNHITFLMTLP
ncbi:MAG: type IX secretion system protein PorQ [Bacteroidales bacterium]|jgi:hypothetical protein|nr:type IX secretion system protein PorQ [Bacteroidales bacterium]